jgi:hypothetical protein
MIKLRNLTPDIYYNESRDFQFIGRLFDVVLNSVKTETDLLYNIPLNDDSNEKLLELMALTLGFKPKHQYNTKQLRAICKVFPEILKNKGSIKAVTIACNAIFNAAGEEQALDYDFKSLTDHTELNLYIPQNFGNINLINDLLYYILPAGMNCNIIRELHLNTDSYTKLQTVDELRIYERGDKEGYFGTNSKYYVYSDNSMAKLVRLESDSDTNIYKGVLNTGDAIRSLVADNPGFIMNSTLYKHEDTIVPNVVADTKEDE